MADWTPSNKEEEKVVDQPWTLYTDGAWGQSGAGAAAVLIAPSGLKLKYAARLEFKATNNIAEYEGLILGLNKAKASGAKTLLIKTDSEVVAGQVEKEYLAHNPELARYLAVVRGMERRFKGFTLQYTPRSENCEADELAKAAANNTTLPEGTFYQTIEAPATESLPKAFRSVLLTEGEDWRQAIADSLNGKATIDDEALTKRMEARARNYTIIDGNLYKKGVVQPLLRCISQTEGRELLQEIHSGMCGSHIGPRALSAKALRQGFYLPTHIKNVEEIVKTCKACQTFSPIQSRPSAPTQLISASWLLQRWGMDLVGPMPTAQGGNKFAVVAIEYFTRWIEAKPLATITSETIRKFFWQNIVCRFGVPSLLTVDNRKQFDSDRFKEFCHHIGTKIAFASVYHPESNEAVERANRIIFSAISKTLLNLRKGKWVDELPRVVWSHNTTVSRATGFTPFKLLYGEEAMLLEEIKHQSLRSMKQQLTEDEEYCKETLESIRLEAVENITKYQQETKKWRDRKVVRKDIQDGDLVLRKKGDHPNAGKLQPKWEGPYTAIQARRSGSFYLKDLEGRTSTHTWNIDNLRRFYI